MTSRCSMEAPPRSTRAISSPRRAKSAARIDGTICTIQPVENYIILTQGARGDRACWEAGTAASFGRGSVSGRGLVSLLNHGGVEAIAGLQAGNAAHDADGMKAEGL